MPRLSVGLPVYNGENFLEACLPCLLGQTYQDFELLISDNASTDGTEAICRRFAEQDERIRYVRLEENVGAAGNFNKTFELATGEYFKWAAHDDLLEPTYFERCVEVLDENPDVVLCYTKVKIIDDQGEIVRDYDNPLREPDADKPHRRFADLIRGVHACYEVFGIMRTEVLRRTPLIGNYTSSDRNLLAELGLIGKLHEVPEPLFLSRHHQKRSVKIDVHARTSWFDTAKTKNKVHMPYWRSIVLESWRSIRRVRMPLGSRFLCYWHLFKTMCRRWRLLRGDVKRVVFRR